MINRNIAIIAACSVTISITGFLKLHSASAQTSPNPSSQGRHHPELVANRCVILHGPSDIYGMRMTNRCSYPVAIAFCTDSPKSSVSCKKSSDDISGGADTIGPGKTSSTSMIVGNYRIYYQACRGKLGDVSPVLRTRNLGACLKFNDSKASTGAASPKSSKLTSDHSVKEGSYSWFLCFAFSPETGAIARSKVFRASLIDVGKINLAWSAWIVPQWAVHSSPDSKDPTCRYAGSQVEATAKIEDWTSDYRQQHDGREAFDKDWSYGN